VQLTGLSATACCTAAPHEGQNFTPSSTGFPHFGQLTGFFSVASFGAACCTAVPHDGQNFTPSSTGFPHFAQRTDASLFSDAVCFAIYSSFTK
jgi:hypothetical protein